MNHHYSHLLLALIALLFFSPSSSIPFFSAQPQRYIEISKLPFQESLQMTSSDTRFYRLVADPPKGLYLIISVLPDQGSDSLKLFVSYSKEFPQNMNDAGDSLITNGVVLMNHDNLKFTSNPLYIGLLCESAKCNAKIFTEWTKEMNAIANEEKTIESSESLNGASSALVRLKIPKEDEIERIIIHVDAIPSSKKESSSSPLEVFINQGKSFPFENDAVNIPRKGQWFEGNTIVIDKDSSLFCIDCIYTLNLKFSESSSISVQAQTYKKNTPISGEPILDGVHKGKENWYQFTKTEYFQEDFVLSVKVHKGKVKVYIDGLLHYENRGHYSWNHQVEDSQDIILPPKNFWVDPIENYFIFIEGEESSVYSLSATYKKSNQLLMGKAPPPVRHKILPQEKITYEILMPLFIAEEITLNLKSKQSLEVDIMNCRFATDCPGVLPANNQHEITNYYGFDDNLPVDKMTEYHSEEIAPGELRITIDPRKSGCYPILIQDQAFAKEPITVCAYQVTLSNQQSSPVEYTLTAGFQGPNLLNIGQSRFDIVAKMDTMYYLFSVPHPKENIEAIQIQLTEFSGDVDIFVSKSNKQFQNDIITLSYEGLIIIKDLSDLSGAYYIGVHGLETSSFSLSATIQTKPKLTEDSAFLLNPGKPQKGVLLPKHSSQAQFYKIALNQDQRWTGMLGITVRSLTGRVLIVANNNGEFPTAENHQWQGKDHDLKIGFSDFYQKKNDPFYVGIFIDMTDPDAQLLTDLTYYITYSPITQPETNRVRDPPNEHPFHMFLSQNTPFCDVIKRNELHYFEALIPTDQFPITIYKQPGWETIELYISTNPKNTRPSQDSSFTEKTTKNSITLEACQTTTTALGWCSVYITAILITDGDYGFSFSLSIFSDQGSSAIALKDGLRIHSIIPMNNRPANFHYHAIPSKLFVVTVSCPPGMEVVMFAKRIKIDVHSQEKPKIEILNENTAEFSGASDIIVPSLADSDFTIVAISVYFKEIDTESELKTTFMIFTSSQITQLPLRTPITGDVQEDTYMYFMTNVTKSECALLISLIHFPDDDETDLVISYGENTRPTISNHQFSLITKKAINVIKIDNTDLSPGHSMSGSWIIGVHGRASDRFQLTAISQDRKMVDLNPGTPIKMMSLSESSFAYFKYDHEVQPNFQINLTKFSGQLNLYMTSIDSNKDFIPHLPNQTHSQWQILSVASQSVMTIDFNNSHGCRACTYLIKIEAIVASKFSLGVNHLSSSAHIPGGLQYRGLLKPQESTVFLLKKSKNVLEENLLDFEMKGNELFVMGSAINQTNYIWKETLTLSNSHHLISLPSEDSKSNSFSLLLENPKDKDVNYNFNMTTRSLQLHAFYGESAERLYSLDHLERHLFVYNSGDSTGFSVDVIFYAEGQNAEAIMKEDLKQGKRLRATYWHANSYSKEEEKEQEVYLEAGAEPKSRSNSTHAIFEQKFSIQNGKGRGKYILEIFHSWKFQVKFRIFIKKSNARKHDFAHYLNNGEERLGYNDPRIYQIDQPDPGNWYFWVYSCLAINLKIENGDPETGMVTIPKREDYLYKETVLAGSRDVWISDHPKFYHNQGRFIMYSSVFDEKEFRDFKLKEENLKVDLSYKKQKENKNEVTVEFKPAELKDPESYDEIDYKIWLCSDWFELSNVSPLCNEKEFYQRCKNSSLKLQKSQKEPVKISFKDVDFEKYLVKIKATIIYKHRAIKDVEPYAKAYVEVKRANILEDL